MQIPVLLPEKLSVSRCLVEVEDATSTDLAGDAGAVGRFATSTHGHLQQAQLDLKGVCPQLETISSTMLLLTQWLSCKRTWHLHCCSA